MKDFDVILASKSPRRKEILENIGIKFDIKVADIDETFLPDLTVEENIERVAFLKATAIAENLSVTKDTYVIGVDTIVVLDNTVMGKPTDEEDAFEMLKALSGKTHKVISGISVIKKEKDAITLKADHDTTLVTMKDIDDETIKRYIQTKEPMDKAGSYAVQGIGSLLIKEIQGNYFNVVGLPVSKFYDIMSDYGVNII